MKTYGLCHKLIGIRNAGEGINRIGLLVLMLTLTAGMTPAEAGIQSMTVSPDGQRIMINGQATFLRGFREGYVGGDWNSVYWNHQQLPEGHPVSPNAPQVDYDAYVAGMKSRGFNYVRLCGIQMQAGSGRVHGTNERNDAYNYPPAAPYTCRPWARTGGGKAWDGLQKYDLNQFDSWYFSHLDEFVRKCNENMIVVEFCFFHQHNLYQIFTHYADNPLRPYNNANNTGLPNGFGQTGYPQYYDLTNATVKAIQEAYVTKVLDTVSQYPGVVYRVADEYNWHASWIENFATLIADYGTAHGRQLIVQAGGSLSIMDDLGPGVHSIDCTFFGLRSPSDICDPPALVNQRLAGYCAPPYGTYDAVYTTFRYLNDRYDKVLVKDRTNRDEWWSGFVAGGGGMFYHGAFYSGENSEGSSGIKDLLPHLVDYDGDLPSDSVISGSSGWAKAIASPGVEYVAYLKTGGWVDLDLTGTSGTFNTRWYSPRTRQFTNQGTTSGGAVRRLTAPNGDDWVVHVYDPSMQPTPTPTPTIGRKGDLEPDGDVDLFDVLRVVDILLGRPPDPSTHEQWAGDMDGDGDIDLFDALDLIDVMLERG